MLAVISGAQYLWLARQARPIDQATPVARSGRLSAVRCDVVAVGTELLLGQIIDSNSAWIGGELAAHGIDSLVQVKVGDNVSRIIVQLRRVLADADAVIMCGGLGPTHDDLTRDAIAAVMGVDLARDESVAEVIREHVRRAGPDDVGQQPASGRCAGRRDDHPADAGDGTGSDLPGRGRRCREGRSTRCRACRTRCTT